MLDLHFINNDNGQLEYVALNNSLLTLKQNNDARAFVVFSWYRLSQNIQYFNLRAE